MKTFFNTQSTQYPFNDEYFYQTKLVRYNLDKVRVDDVETGKGFIIKAPKGIKKDIKLQSGIFSNRYGSTLDDVDSFNGKYRCDCGLTRGSVHHGDICPHCGRLVTYRDDDVSIFGYLVLKDKYWIIHPNMYRSIEAFIGANRLNRIIEPDVKVDKNGREIPDPPQKNGDEPFRHIGMLQFKERFDEIMEFYLKRFPTKRNYYNNIMMDKELIFTHTVAVFSSLLRPSKLDNGSLRYEKTNEYYNLLSSLVYNCNKDKLRIDRRKKEKLQLLYDIQFQYNELYIEIKEIISKKKGDIRSALGGRVNFSSRSVIKQATDLKANEVRLPLFGLLELLQQLIINILVKTYNFPYPDAYKKWYKAQLSGTDKVVNSIVEKLIEDSDGGLDLLINRNPTISFGGVIKCKCVGVNYDYTMSVSLLVLKILAADFDGDTLNIYLSHNKAFIEIAERIISPIQMFISHNDGRCNIDMIHSRDTIINANALKNISRYSEQEKQKIKWIQSIQ